MASSLTLQIPASDRRFLDARTRLSALVPETYCRIRNYPHHLRSFCIHGHASPSALCAGCGCCFLCLTQKHCWVASSAQCCKQTQDVRTAPECRHPCCAFGTKQNDTHPPDQVWYQYSRDS